MPENIALVGSETLLGKEVREVFGQSELGQDLRLLAAPGEEPGKLAEVGDSISFLTKVDPDTVEDSAIVILAGPPESSREVMDLHPSGTIIDLTYYLEDVPNARVRAPILESGVDNEDGAESLAGPQIVAHPAATAMAMVLTRLHEAHPIRRSIIHIFEPASERGMEGIEELQGQTMSLLNFQQLPKKVYDTQLSFAMLAQFGEEAPTRLVDIEERIERHLATLLQRFGGVPMPSLRLLQAPVFHGYTFSLWIEFEEGPTPDEIEDVLRDELIDVRTSDTEAPSNIGAAGQSGVIVGGIQPDRNNADAVWLWMAGDNLRIAAETAAIIAREIL